MKNFEKLERFIKLHPFTWKKRLRKAPYCLGNIKSPPYNKNWYMFTYNMWQSDFYNPVVRCCRGTVLEVKGFLFKKIRPICMPYKKFANYGEGYADKIDWESAVAREKIDGILIKCSKVDGKTYWFTNNGYDWTMPFGTDFSTDDGEKETAGCKTFGDLLKYALYKELNLPTVKTVGGWKDYNKYFNNINNIENSWLSKIPEGWTLMFELVSPRNRIICKYPHTKLYFHGARDAEGQEHIPEKVAEDYGIPYAIPKIYDCCSPEGIKKLVEDFKGIEQEGVVVCDKNFNRVKIKCSSYLQLKFTVDNDKPKNIFKMVVENTYDDILPSMPELKPSIDDMQKSILEFKAALKEYYEYINNIRSEYTDRAKYAEYVKSNVNPLLTDIAFKCDKDYESLVDLLLKKYVNLAKGYNMFVETKEALLAKKY